VVLDGYVFSSRIPHSELLSHRSHCTGFCYLCDCLYHCIHSVFVLFLHMQQEEERGHLQCIRITCFPNVGTLGGSAKHDSNEPETDKTSGDGRGDQVNPVCSILSCVYWMNPEIWRSLFHCSLPEAKAFWKIHYTIININLTQLADVAALQVFIW
jgi:hypothetical protein